MFDMSSALFVLGWGNLIYNYLGYTCVKFFDVLYLIAALCNYEVASFPLFYFI